MTSALDALDSGARTAVVLVVAGLAYLGYRLLWPMAKCKRCGGTGKESFSPNGRNFRICRRCGGNGKRRHLLPRLFDRPKKRP